MTGSSNGGKDRYKNYSATLRGAHSNPRRDTSRSRKDGSQSPRDSVLPSTITRAGNSDSGRSRGRYDNRSTARNVHGDGKDAFDRYDKRRPVWTPTKQSTDPLPSVTCSLCQKPITELSSAVRDTEDGVFHFDCIREKLAAHIILKPGEVFAYIGGGRFGVVNRDGASRSISIRDIVELEPQKTEPTEWRKILMERYSRA